MACKAATDLPFIVFANDVTLAFAGFIGAAQLNRALGFEQCECIGPRQTFHRTVLARYRTQTPHQIDAGAGTAIRVPKLGTGSAGGIVGRFVANAVEYLEIRAITGTKKVAQFGLE